MSNKVWRVLYIKSNYEKIVSNDLNRMGIIFYIPTYKKPTRKNGKVVFVKKLLLRGYIFVQVEKGKEAELLGIQGVLNYIKVGKEIGLVRKDEIANIRRLCGLANEVELTNNKINIGDRVTIASGHLYGIEGIVEKQGNRHAFYVLLDGAGLGLRFLIDKRHLILREGVGI